MYYVTRDGTILEPEMVYVGRDMAVLEPEIVSVGRDGVVLGSEIVYVTRDRVDLETFLTMSHGLIRVKSLFCTCFCLQGPVLFLF